MRIGCPSVRRGTQTWEGANPLVVVREISFFFFF